MIELTDEEFFCLEGCRSFEQYYQLRQNFERHSCTFCDLDRKLNAVEWEDEFAYAWLVPKAYLRSELAYHALFVPKRHVRFETELMPSEVLSIHEAKKALHRAHGYRGGCTHVREGNMRLNAGTIPHLHYNTFMPNGTGSVRIPVFKDPGLQEGNKERAAMFAARYEQGEVP